MPGIIVVGVPRSGTSLVAELITRWGAYPGGALTPADRWNAQGYWEHVGLVQFTNDLFKSCGASLTTPPDPGLLRQRATEPEWRDRARHLIAAMEQEAPEGVWMWKYPPVSILLPFWQAIWDRSSISYVLALRHPVDAAWSQRRLFAERHGGTVGPPAAYPLAKVLVLWQYYMAQIFATTSGLPLTILDYDMLLQEPERICQQLAGFLGQSVGYAGAYGAMIEAVDPALCHRNGTGDALPEDVFTPQQRQLYAQLVAKSQQPDLNIPAALLELPANWQQATADLTRWWRSAR